MSYDFERSYLLIVLTQTLEQVVNGGAEAGFRVQLLQQYQSLLLAHNMIEGNISREEIKALSRYECHAKC